MPVFSANCQLMGFMEVEQLLICSQWELDFTCEHWVYSLRVAIVCAHETTGGIHRAPKIHQTEKLGKSKLVCNSICLCTPWGRCDKPTCLATCLELEFFLSHFLLTLHLRSNLPSVAGDLTLCIVVCLTLCCCWIPQDVFWLQCWVFGRFPVSDLLLCSWMRGFFLDVFTWPDLFRLEFMFCSLSTQFSFVYLDKFRS